MESRKPRIGIVGLGNIAQKAYLPILMKETDWQLAGAYSPNQAKREKLCKNFRINSINSLAALSSKSDAVFVHTSTETHYEVVSYLLGQGKDVYVDKPLAASLDQAVRLAELSEETGRKLMVGFNRRFAPLYRKAREMSVGFDWVQMEKHRTDSIGPDSFAFTMLDDYLHIIDTIRWLADQSELKVTDLFTRENETGQMLLAKHSFQTNGQHFTTAMHRRAGTNLEKLEIVNEQSIIRVNNLNTLQVEAEGCVTESSSASWEELLTTKGFTGAVSHFISAIKNDKTPDVDGWDAVKSQQLLDKLIDRHQRK
ncbi:gfo/Idh/MocA family oxidoreductase [Sediminibacillus dalangtanensis]|uniref:Gfo/Idh/MocA family oxidoreductase n=1 Tax=Sediminibacillus dalangtanensis TaxID=2729421 RepID=A0ABX7VNT6_9BACI|nr:Gfo/Idh/MocA family oxidoreductase [Sediminibacillus dalangtanensis]QTM98539.1 gfo/Idh/MocA family oxidoreductase [Sediminibacillus dalangtanensis]